MITLERNSLHTSWYNLRQHLESAINPFKDVADFFHKLPRVKIYTDPYDRTTWPTPWELIEENQFCNFNIVLGICYTLQLTERFKLLTPKIHISIDTADKNLYYLLIIDNAVYGFGSKWTTLDELPKSLITQKIYAIPQIG